MRCFFRGYMDRWKPLAVANILFTHLIIGGWSAKAKRLDDGYGDNSGMPLRATASRISASAPAKEQRLFASPVLRSIRRLKREGEPAYTAELSVQPDSITHLEQVVSLQCYISSATVPITNAWFARFDHTLSYTAALPISQLTADEQQRFSIYTIRNTSVSYQIGMNFTLHFAGFHYVYICGFTLGEISHYTTKTYTAGLKPATTTVAVGTTHFAEWTPPSQSTTLTIATSNTTVISTLANSSTIITTTTTTTTNHTNSSSSSEVPTIGNRNNGGSTNSLIIVAYTGGPVVGVLLMVGLGFFLQRTFREPRPQVSQETGTEFAAENVQPVVRKDSWAAALTEGAGYCTGSGKEEEFQVRYPSSSGRCDNSRKHNNVKVPILSFETSQEPVPNKVTPTNVNESYDINDDKLNVMRDDDFEDISQAVRLHSHHLGSAKDIEMEIDDNDPGSRKQSFGSILDVRRWSQGSSRYIADHDLAKAGWCMNTPSPVQMDGAPITFSHLPSSGLYECCEDLPDTKLAEDSPTCPPGEHESDNCENPILQEEVPTNDPQQSHVGKITSFAGAAVGVRIALALGAGKGVTKRSNDDAALKDEVEMMYHRLKANERVLPKDADLSLELQEYQLPVTDDQHVPKRRQHTISNKLRSKRRNEKMYCDDSRLLATPMSARGITPTNPMTSPSNQSCCSIENSDIMPRARSRSQTVSLASGLRHDRLSGQSIQSRPLSRAGSEYWSHAPYASTSTLPMLDGAETTSRSSLQDIHL